MNGPWHSLHSQIHLQNIIIFRYDKLVLYELKHKNNLLSTIDVQIAGLINDNKHLFNKPQKSRGLQPPFNSI